MRRGEVWWVELDELRPVVLLGGDETSGFEAMQIVPPSVIDMSGLGIEVPVGAIEGLPYQGVLRVAFPNPEFVFCTWLTTVTRESLIERAGVLPPAKLDEIDEALQLASRPRALAPGATARLSEIRDALRRGQLQTAIPSEPPRPCSQNAPGRNAETGAGEAHGPD